MAEILVSGGSGMVGRRLCKLLVDRGHIVTVLSRSKKHNASDGVSYAFWDPDSGKIDINAVNNSDIIIHLAGENIGAGRWTSKRKRSIVDSRIRTSKMILKALEKNNNKLKVFVSASAIGYYGSVSTESIYTEDDPPGNDFLAVTCQKWEDSADSFHKYGVRVLKFRTAVVLTKTAGVLSKLNFPVSLGLGSAIGNGKQYFPWIHIDDLCYMYLYAIDNPELSGSYNAVAPEHINMDNFVRTYANLLNRPYWFPKIPSILIKIIFGEMSQILLEGSRISSAKIRGAGFTFKYPSLYKALSDIYKKQ